MTNANGKPTTTYISTTDCAKLMRKALKANFPGVKFSVRSKSYSGGSSITAEWIDGPRSDDVQAVIDRFTGASFDGMQDLKTYRNEIVSNEDGSLGQIHYCANFAFTRRNFSEALKNSVRAQLVERYGVEFLDLPYGYTDTEIRDACHWSEGGAIDFDRYRMDCNARAIIDERRKVIAAAQEATQTDAEPAAAAPVDPWAVWIENAEA